MPDEPQKKDTPLPVQMAQEALKVLALEDTGLADDMKKRLPAFAMQLAKSGEDVTVELLLDHARIGKLEKEATPKPKTYSEIAAWLPGAEINNRLYIVNAIHAGDLDTVKRLANERAHISNSISNLDLNVAAWFGTLDIVKYFVEEHNIDVHAGNEDALTGAAKHGNRRLDIVKYLVEECGANAHISDELVLREACVYGHLDLVKYLVEEQNADPHLSSEFALWAASINGHLDIVKYLVKEQGADVHTYDELSLKDVARNGHLDVLKYLTEQGADIAVIPDHKKEELESYLAACKVWQSVVHSDPPSALYQKDPAYFRPKTYVAVRRMLRPENYDREHDTPMPFYTAALFGTEDRVLQYLEKWGKAGHQPLHNIIHMIKLPAQKTPGMDLKAWGDAVLKCGPSMAKLVKFADRLPVPEKSDDGRTWSMTKTREKVALFAYKKAAGNPALAALCMEHDVEESAFNKALELIKISSPEKNIPDIIIDGKEFDMPGATFRRLAANDIRGLLLGELTDCCQSIGGAGEECAASGFTSRNMGFYVVENAKGRIVGQTWAWRGEKGELVFDSLETLGQNVKADQWLKLTKAFKESLAGKPGNITALHIGTGGATPHDLARAFNTVTRPTKPLNYKGYRDSGQQVVVWRAPAL